MHQPKHVTLNPPFCVKCGRQVMSASVSVHPQTQVAHLQYVCHGVVSGMKFTHTEMMQFGPNTSLIDFAECRRVEE